MPQTRPEVTAARAAARARAPQPSPAAVAGTVPDIASFAANLPAVLYQFRVEADGSMHVSWVSDAIERLLGTTAAAVQADYLTGMGRTVLAEDLEAVARSIPPAVSARAPWSAEFRARPRGVEVRWFRATAHPRAAGGGALVYDGVILDITQEKREAQARAESDARLRSLAANMPGVMYQWRVEPDGTHRCTFISDGVRLLFGLEPAAVYVDLAVLESVVHPDDRGTVAAAMDRAVHDLAPFTIEFRTHVRGAMRWLRSIATPRREPDGAVTCDAVVVDITHEKAVARRLAEGERRLQAAVDGARDGIWDLDFVADRAWASARTWALLGHAPGEHPIAAATWRELLHPDDRRAWYHALRAYRRDPGGGFRCEGRIRGADGTWRWLELRGRALCDGDGTPLRVSGTVTDIAARKADEAALREARRTAETANVAKSQFLAQMSHELRTPLNSIIGFSRVLVMRLGASLAERERTYLERIHANGEHLLGLIDDILDVSKIEAGRVVVERRRVDLNVVATDVVAQLEGRVMGSRTVLVADVPAEPTWHETDVAKLRQVLINLVGNAVKFTEQGTVRVTVVPSADGHPAIAVHDTGIGIPADRLEAIFAPFEQGEQGTSRRFGGTGLGLAIARSLTELLDAELTVDSTLGAGSTFTVRFRAVRD